VIFSLSRARGEEKKSSGTTIEGGKGGLGESGGRVLPIKKGRGDVSPSGLRGPEAHGFPARVREKKVRSQVESAHKSKKKGEALILFLTLEGRRGPVTMYEGMGGDGVRKRNLASIGEGEEKKRKRSSCLARPGKRSV